MKRHSGRGVAALYGVAVVALASSPIPGTPLIRSALADTDEGSAACTVASLRGGYVVSVNGFVTLNGQGDTSPNGTVSQFTPVMEIGTFAFDGAGTVSRAVTVSVGGIPFPVNDTGTYVTNADCSGSIALSANSDTFNFNVVDKDSIAIVPMKLGQSGAGTFPYADTGTYQVNSDCTLSAYFPSDTEAFQIIAIDANRLVEGVVTLGRVGAGTLVRQRR